VFYIAFILVMIASLAAVGLAPGIGSTGGGHSGVDVPEDEEGVPIEEQELGLTSFEGPQKTIDATVSHKAIIQTDEGEIVVALNPEAPEAANSFAYLAGENFYDGLEFFWVLPEFTVQAGDPTCESSGEFGCTGRGSPGYTLPKEGDGDGMGQWSVIAPVTTPGGEQVHGSQFVIALTDAEFEGSVIGVVVKGQEILEALEERVPCFGSNPSESNPCQPNDELPPALVIKDVIVQPD
jgi:cyclophilin family peptidyl-prolyl cis-trans isomerase